ncbi:flagellar hook-basal body complex protein FliE [Spirochaetota bacterium]|nr:flagellar hook-basal body complex protein FliE [Spirochaetota bacterium]
MHTYYNVTQKVPVAVTNDKHYVNFDLSLEEAKKSMLGTGDTFYEKLMNAVELTNKQVVSSDSIAEQFITKPNTVNVHDVVIAAQKAQLSIDLTKNVIERAISAYQNITNLR